ncbi:hypothetical protein LTR91_012273 [Friedmanniomyces endolithicus]|uniref:Uncharacterized protein n=1 Tax=Friedmanniomyces endolithicus TaxID=329885 RepID=A0AAN6QR04_9PEZI|nr:hypothetical protein LTR57_019718 [Friedmanniomyces endolithicus]KAK0964597.1 hypothetical protein LTS01_018762 [Friedmanniomyces endolithicus]KAK0980442.1 hypothetical protein LTR91_012273 [Friedmanniomyces endolithicus]KAK1041636.1 hypothetical protein LTS16_009411 [Friedmanniomyces endolithicus]
MSGISGAISAAEESEDTDANMSTLNSGSTHHTTKSHRYGQARKEKLAAALLKRFEKKPAVSNSRRTIDAEHIEYLWRRKLTECLPPELKPRLRAGNGKRMSIGEQDRKRLHVRQWTKALLRALEKLAFITPVNSTPVDRDNAYAKLIAQVKRRQRQRVHVEHYAREVLTSDIEAVTQEFKGLKDAGRYPIKAKKPARVDRRDLDLPPDLAEGQWQEVYFRQSKEANEKKKATVSERVKVAEVHSSQG